ncbi:MAG TPA: TIR domain-containing protein [Mucilaginibacter sp.]|jgi:hypothetical protein
MGMKIFVTYKYGDSLVQNLPEQYFSTARNYVDELYKLLKADDHIYKGENDGEDLSEFKDELIWDSLKDKIFDSSVTLVVISKGMKEYGVSDEDQWMPWEISYSLKELSRNGIYSKTNAVLAVVLPDENGSNSYFLTHNPACNSTNYNTDILFTILKKNMFNRASPQTHDCNGNVIHTGRFSYIHCVTWQELKNNLSGCVDIAVEIKNNSGDYLISKVVN